MKKFVFLLTILTVGSISASADEDAKKQLLGAWSATSMKANGSDVPERVLKSIRLTFTEKALRIRGNFGDDREQSCTYKIDATKKPHHFEFTPPRVTKPIQGIYELKEDDVLKICVRHANAEGGRPTEFKSTPDSRIIMFVLRREKTPKP